MRKGKIVASILTLATVVTLLHSVPVNATAVSSSKEVNTTELDNEMQPVTEQLEPEDISVLEANIMDREYTGGQFSISETKAATLSNDETNVDAIYSTDASEGITTDEAVVSSNTDPNNAYIVTNDSIQQETIGAAGEIRWYAFVLNEKSKVTINLQMVEALDADLYMYSLNKATNQLELIGGSATACFCLLSEYCRCSQ